MPRNCAYLARKKAKREDKMRERQQAWEEAHRNPSGCPIWECIDGYVFYRRDTVLPIGVCGYCNPQEPKGIKLRRGNG